MAKLENRLDEFKLACAIAGGSMYVGIESLGNAKNGEISTPIGVQPITEVLYHNSRLEELILSWEEYLRLGQRKVITGKISYMPRK